MVREGREGGREGGRERSKEKEGGRGLERKIEGKDIRIVFL